jgi:hypothetical protein
MAFKMIYLITPTGARKDQFELCAFYMYRQTYTGQVTWVIIDDADPLSTNNVKIDFRENWTICKVYPKPTWKGENTQARNIAAGISLIENNEDIEAIFIIEDDDYYKPYYVEKMLEHLKGFDIAGEKNTIYYNVKHRRYLTNPNTLHSSLFQTAFTKNALPALKKAYSHKFIDCMLWSLVKNKNLFNDYNLSVGIKGLPGRGGIGAGHTAMIGFPFDQDLKYLKTLTSEEDAEKYRRYYSDSRVLQHSQFNQKRR